MHRMLVPRFVLTSSFNKGTLTEHWQSWHNVPHAHGLIQSLTVVRSSVCLIVCTHCYIIHLSIAHSPRERISWSINLDQRKRVLVLDVWRVGESWCVCLMISEMAGPIWVKLSGVVKYVRENDLAKEFFEKNEKKLMFLATPYNGARRGMIKI